MSGKVQSVERALLILELISDYEEGLRIIDISKKLELHKSTTHRLLNTLVQLKYVYQDTNTNKYCLTFKVVELANKKIDGKELLSVARPHIVNLKNEVNEIVHVVVRDGMEITYIDKVEANNPIDVSSKVGERNPLYSTSVGKAILSNMSEEELDDILNSVKLERFTENTITDIDKLKSELQIAKKNGYAVDDQENEIGIRCLGSSIFNSDKNVEGAISISGPTFRITEENIDEYGRIVSHYADLISRDLGYIK